ncbi:MAG: undecaprenyldiphospho-muramoylpentapeptide beta-N-acetylglucosaminyltransferase [Deltaproteobacteria bacterium]|nr:undecaprenyldiphospho-muramoylpentapeptide beta-N-acetylglucosaminyltransferase [Deltaproteobacteria bacterium]
MATVLVAGGGTGGHVFPMMAVGEALREQAVGTGVAYVGTPRGLEAKLLAERGERIELLDVLPLRGGGLRGALRGGLRALTVLPEAGRLVRRIGPDVVFSVGGYAAGPVALAAWREGVPLALLEPNAVLGFTNRLLRPLACRAYLGFPELAPAFAAGRARVLGIPLRPGFAPVPYVPTPGRARLLVLGGSQGALALNEALPRAIAIWAQGPAAAGVALQVVHQCGRDKDTAVRALYAELGLAAQAEVATFIDDVAGALARADLVVARAGASSLGELCAVGRAALLVPYPYAADDHQKRNAESLARDGAAVCVVQAEATPERLAAELGPLLAEPERREAMARQAARRGRPEAASAIAADLLGLAQQGAREAEQVEAVP